MPAGAVIREPQALPGFTGRKGCVGGNVSRSLNPVAQPRNRERNGIARGCEGSVELMV